MQCICMNMILDTKFLVLSCISQCSHVFPSANLLTLCILHMSILSSKMHMSSVSCNEFSWSMITHPCTKFYHLFHTAVHSLIQRQLPVSGHLGTKWLSSYNQGCWDDYLIKPFVNISSDPSHK
ncbi:hypothetical protein M758_UG114600 [Ceratodon purpureus]|nr:hypothetical protein M758_UG114600 [Ceratodon purpureus]